MWLGPVRDAGLHDLKDSTQTISAVATDRGVFLTGLRQLKMNFVHKCS